MRLKLTGRTLKGKNKIREHGDVWIIIGSTEQAQCFNNLPATLIQSEKDKDRRWIKVTNDDDFIASIIES
jgi:hypothetical protein